MTTYRAPQRDMRFVLHELLEVEQLAGLRGCEEATADLIDHVIGEAAKLCETVLLPLDRSGDEEGCVYENGVVRTPKGFKEAYDTFTAAGWTGLAAAPEYGGQGLPKSIKFVVDEMVCSANMAFANYPGLSAGAYLAIDTHASEELQALYLPKLAEGRWSGTMCLTEPQCGTDLGLIRTRAEPNGDGTFAITGTKIFITSGEHDLTENIVHLVLARLPDAPKGVKGISLFLVPKFLPKPDGRPGPRNGVACAGIEHKMGINGSATCVMSFERATGWLLSEPHRGMRATTEGARALAYWVGMQVDLAKKHPEAEVRQAAEDLLALMTPIVKAYLTDQGSACANLGVQIMGGHGYIRESGMEQLVRDARITQLYEGANGIQALDLVGRKLPAHYGRHLRTFFHPVMALIERHQSDAELAEFVLPLAKAFARLQQITLHVAQQGLRDPDEAAAASADYLRLFALVAMAYMWTRMVQVARAKLAVGADGDASFYEAKIRTARFFMTKMLPESGALFAQIMAGGRSVMEFDQAAF